MSRHVNAVNHKDREGAEEAMSILVCCPLQLLLQGPPATVAAASGTSLAFLVTYTYCLNLKQMQEKALEPYCSQQVLKSVMPRCETFKHKQTSSRKTQHKGVCVQCSSGGFRKVAGGVVSKARRLQSCCSSSIARHLCNHMPMFVRLIKVKQVRTSTLTPALEPVTTGKNLLA